MSGACECVWCGHEFGSTIPGLCDELRVAIESGEEHESSILAFALELALSKEPWPYCSRRCDAEDEEHFEMHPERESLLDTLGGVGALPWDTIREEAEAAPNVIPIQQNEEAALRLLEAREQRVVKRVRRPPSTVPVFGSFFAGLFLGALAVWVGLATETDPRLRLSGLGILMGGGLGCIAMMMQIRRR